MTGQPQPPPGASPPPSGPGGYWQQFDGSQRGPGYQGYPPYAGPTGPMGPRLDQMAILSLISSVVGFVSWAFCPAFPLGFGAAGLVLGILSMRRIKKDPERWSGRGLAIGGVVVGAIGLVLFLVLAFFMGFAVATDMS